MLITLTTVVTVETELFPAFGSVLFASTEARLVIVPPTIGVTLTVTVAGRRFRSCRGCNPRGQCRRRSLEWS